MYQQICRDDTVEVGADLYKIDTDSAKASISPDAGIAPKEVPVLQPADATPTSLLSSLNQEAINLDGHVRIPSIQFLGKSGWKDKLSVVANNSTQQQQQPAVQIQQQPTKPNGAITLDGTNLSRTYGRIPISEREMEALIMGGASELY